MPILLKTEYKNPNTQLIIGLMYLVLVVGGLSMVYPFLIMISGSLKSQVDSKTYDVYPRFLHDDNLLYKKYVEAKCPRVSGYFQG